MSTRDRAILREIVIAAAIFLGSVAVGAIIALVRRELAQLFVDDRQELGGNVRTPSSPAEMMRPLGGTVRDQPWYSLRPAGV